MFEKIRNLKNKKGFTLVELIVVLVILAILAALLVPALTGYIDKAKEQSITAECRMTVMAAQTKIDELYGTVALGSKISENVSLITTEKTPSSFVKGADGTGTFTLAVSEIAALSEIKYDQDNVPKIESIKISIDSTDASKPIGKIVELVYSNDNKTCTYANGVYTTTNKA